MAFEGLRGDGCVFSAAGLLVQRPTVRKPTGCFRRSLAQCGVICVVRIVVAHTMIGPAMDRRKRCDAASSLETSIPRNISNGFSLLLPNFLLGLGRAK